MAALDCRILLVACVVLRYFGHYGNCFVILDDADKAHENVQQMEENGAYLLKVLKQLQQISPFPEDQIKDTLVTDVDERNSVFERDPSELQSLLQLLQENRDSRISVSKKDFAILPPASEWCRMMGFRRCRTRDSH